MNNALAAFPWTVVLYHLFCWLAIILPHIIFIGIAPRIDGEIVEAALQ